MSTAWYWPDWNARPLPEEVIVHYLGRTEEECIAAGQTSICEGCKALGHPSGFSTPSWGAKS